MRGSEAMAKFDKEGGMGGFVLYGCQRIFRQQPGSFLAPQLFKNDF
jgi:hypothetical protein